MHFVLVWKWHSSWQDIHLWGCYAFSNISKTIKHHQITFAKQQCSNPRAAFLINTWTEVWNIKLFIYLNCLDCSAAACRVESVIICYNQLSWSDTLTDISTHITRHKSLSLMWWTNIKEAKGECKWLRQLQLRATRWGLSETNVMGRAKCELKHQQDVEQEGFKAGRGGRWAVEALIQTDIVWTTVTKAHINMEPIDSLQKMILSLKTGGSSQPQIRTWHLMPLYQSIKSAYPQTG